MIYIKNNSDNKIVTESWLDFIPSSLLIYFDDIEIGEFINESTVISYIIFSIPMKTIEDLKLENMEYNMKIYVNYSLFKEELLTIESGNVEDLFGYIRNDKKIKMYERK